METSPEKKPSSTQSPKEKISFKPLHEGMGFHPFSDGLPYAPESKSKYSKGTGAVSAGRPQFARPVSRPATKNSIQTSTSSLGRPVGTARQMNPQLKSQLKPQQINARQEPKKIHPEIEALLSQPQTHEFLQTAPQTGVLRRRFFAYLMDTFIHAGFWLVTNLAALFFFDFQMNSELVTENWTQFALFFLISQWMFIALQEMLFENSIGKLFFNLEFHRNHGSLLLRSMVFMFGAACAGIGLLFRWQDLLGKVQLKSKLYAK